MKEIYLNPDEEAFRNRSILAVCAAGTDRSRYIAEELTERGYFANSAGVIEGHNYVTMEDLVSVGVIVFSSIHEKKIFDKNRRLVEMVKQNGIQIRVLNITESDKDRAHCGGDIAEFRGYIKRQLDCVGLVGY